MKLEKIKAIIQQKLAALQALHAEAEAGCDTVTLDQSCVGRLSRMDAMQAQAMNQAAQRRRSIEIARLEKALANIKSDDYGYCEQCDEPIIEGRLMLDPATQYCIQCAEKLEQK